MNGCLLSLRDLDAPALLWHDGRAQDYLDAWARHVGPVRHRHDADAEDFWEQAARLHAAARSFGAHHTWLTTYDKQREPGPARNLATGEIRPLSALADLTPYGSQHAPDARHGGDHGMPASEIAAGRYMTDEAFLANAGRRAILCGSNAPGSPDLWATIAHLAEVHPQRVVVKTATTKAGLWMLDVPAGCSRQDVFRLDGADELGWDAVRREGDPDAYLVQQWVPMRYEYRLFVVDHYVATGAGCVEEHTPLDNQHPLDTKLREIRGSQQPVEDRPDIVRTLRRFGIGVVAQALHERPGLTDYVLDVALDADDQPLVVERNGLLNSGLYASDPTLVTDALRRRQLAGAR